MCKALDFLDAHLAKGGQYICGAKLTIADLLIFHEATNVEVYRSDIRAWKHVNSWYSKVLGFKEVNEIHVNFRRSVPEFQANLDRVTINNELTLYTDVLSQPCRAVMALLALGKIQHEVKNVELFVDTRTPEFQNINHFGTVPALHHGIVKIGDSNAIMPYLCEAFPDQLRSYYGRSLAEKAHINEFMSWYQSTYRPGILAVIRLKLSHVRFLKKPIRKSQLVEAEEKVVEALEKLESKLSRGTPYLCGARLTIVDILVFQETTDALV
jgi:glutathione S-transferase